MKTITRILIVVALALLPAVAAAAPPQPGTIRSPAIIEVDAPASGTNRLDTLTVTGMASYTTQAYVKSLSAYFKLVPTTGSPPDGTTLINATDGRQWQIIASGGGGGGGGATGVTPGAYGDGQHVATYTVQSDGRLTLAGSSTISIGSTAISDSTSLGRSLVTAASAGAAQSALSLVPGTNVQVYDSDLAAIAALSTAADKCIYFSGVGAAALYTCTAAGRTWAGLADAAAQTAALNAFSSTLKGLVPASGGGASNFLRADGAWAAPAGGGGGDMLAANNLSDLANITTARTNLGVAIGTNVQAFDAELAALAGLVSAADRVPYFTGSGTAAVATYTATARSWDALSTVAAETAALNAFTTTLAGMCPASGGGTTNFLRADGTWAAPPGGGGITALTGDVTASGTGSVAATVANIPAGVTVAGKLVRTEIAAPATPSAGTVATWVDSTDARLHDKNPAGTIGTTVVSNTCTTNQVATAISAAGVMSCAQLGVSNLSSSTSSALATMLSDETGTGLACFATNPTLTGATMAGRLNLGDNPIDCGSGYHNDGNKTGAAPALADFSTTCNSHTWTLTGNVTGTPTWTIGGAKHFEVWVCQDATGSRTQTWPSTPTLIWAGSGSAPTLTTTASACDVIDFTYNGTTIVGQAVASGGGGGATTLTGDVTGTGTGTVATTVANIPAGVTVAGRLIRTEIAAPATPSAGTVATWVDSTDARLHDKNPAGTIGTTVVSSTAGANQFATGVSVAGVMSYAQPTIGNVAAFTSSAFAAVCSDETGTNHVVMSTNPVFDSYNAHTEIAAPAAPSAGSVRCWADSTAHNWFCENSSTVSNHGIQTVSCAANSFATSTLDSGALGCAQPTVSNLSSSTSSALATVISDETGTGALCFATSPTLVTPVLGAASATSLAMGNGAVTAVKAVTYNGVFDNGNEGGAAPALLTWANGSSQKLTLTSSITGTPTWTLPTGTQYLQLDVCQNGTGGFVMTWPAVTWDGGSAPVLLSAASACTRISLRYDGTTVTGTSGALYAKLVSPAFTAPNIGAATATSIAMGNGTITSAKAVYLNGKVAGGNKTGATVALFDWTAGPYQTITLTGNVTGTSTCTAPSGTILGLTALVLQDGTGSRTVASWCPGTKWVGGAAPTLTTTASRADRITCDYDGTNYWCKAELNVN